MRRLVRRFEKEGDAAVIHRLRGRPSNRRVKGEVRVRALQKARETLYKDFGPTLLSEHLARDPVIGSIHPSTLRLWLIADGRWEITPRKHKHRRRRERRPCYGELVLMDTSIHPWLEERSTEEIVLIAMIDDATSRLYARFFPRDTGAANRQLLIDYLRLHGRMGALYTDRAGHFEVHFRASERREKDLEAGLTLIERGLAALEIELIRALSPQAKGRVERLFGTLQDRLIKEMRVAGISSLEEANRFLQEVFIPFWNERFVVEPAQSADAHRPLPGDADLLRLFAETEERVIRADFVFRYNSRYFQIEADEADGAMPRRRLTIEERLDGTTHFRWRGRYLQPTALAAPPQPKQTTAPACPKPHLATGAADRPPAADHPWRRFPVLVGRGRMRTSVVAAASLRPDTHVAAKTPSTSTKPGGT